MRLAFVTDLHLGGTSDGFQQQPRWVGGGAELVRHLSRWLDDHQVDAIIYGGDIVEHATREEVGQAVSLLSGCKTRALVCLGNHDLSTRQSYEAWQQELVRWPQATLGDAQLESTEGDVYVVNNRWAHREGPQFYWDPSTSPDACLTENQAQWLHRVLGQRTDRPAIVVAHAPVDGLPPELTGLEHPIHEAPMEYAKSLTAVLEAHPRVGLLLAGHCHATCAIRHGHRVHAMTAALGEVPFQSRLIDVRDGTIRVETAEIAPGPEGLALNGERAWTSGRPGDRAFAVERARGR